jgi:hypothetical protein
MKPELLGLFNTDRPLHRSKEFLFYSYLGMLGATNRFGPSQQRLPPTFMMSYGTILLQSMLALEIWTSSQ